MTDEGIRIDRVPELRDPILLVGFEGWGDAMGVSSGMANYLIRKLQGKAFAKLNPDLFFRYDENRPLVTIAGGTLKSFLPPGGTFYAVSLPDETRDLIVLKSMEPALRWFQFAEDTLDLCRRLGVERIISAGSMYDNVLHEDQLISAIVSDDGLLAQMAPKSVAPVHYQGPGAVHAILHQEGQNRGLACVSLWCHCPYYLQGTTHFGMLARLTSLVAELGGFRMDVRDLETNWQELQSQIQELIDSKPELKDIIAKLKHEQEQAPGRKPGSALTHEKVIDLKDFLNPK